jgi:hypothetical protein
LQFIRPSICRLTCVGALVLLAGCAVQPVAPAATLLHPASRLTVLELPPTVSDDSLRRIFHAEEKSLQAEVLAADRRQLQQLIDGELKQALSLARLPLLSSATVAPLDDVQGMAIGQPMDAGSLAALQSQHPADAYLRVELTDYGQTPKSWRSAYVTFEVVTTAAIGAVLYTRTATRPLAIAYLGEESVEELSEGYAGFWLVNRLSRPVRIDVDLVDGATGTVLWHDTETGLAGWHWKNLWHMDDPTRDLLLKTSADQAASDLVGELEGKRP